MPKLNRLQRQAFRNRRAAEAARRREELDPWRQACRRVREHRLPPSCALFVDAVAQRHRELGDGVRGEPVFIGYGDGTPAERRSRRRPVPQQPRHPGRLPSLSEVTGRSRRTMMRVRKLLEGLDILRCHRERTREREYTCRSSGAVRTHEIGVGGCDEGGLGLANAYWPFDAGDPVWTEPRPRPPVPPDPPASGRMAQLLDQVRGRAPTARSRGP